MLRGGVVRRMAGKWRLIAAIGLIGCSNDVTGPKASEIKVNLLEIIVDQRDSVQLIPSVVDAKGTLLSGVPVTFSTRDPSIASVSGIGVVTSIGPVGTTEVVIKASGLVRTVPVTVHGVATKLVVTPNPGTMPQKGTLQLTAQLLDRVDAPIAGAPFTYEGAQPAIATVNATGLVTSVGPAGLATFAIRSGSFAITVQVAVTQVATRIDVTPTPVKVSVGRTRSLGARLLDAVDEEIKLATFTYTSNAPTVVTVGADGLLTSVGGLGSAIVTVRAQGTALSADVPVTIVTTGRPVGVVSTIAMPNGSYAVVAVSETEGYASNLGGPISRLDLVSGQVKEIPGSHGGLSLAASSARRELYSAVYDHPAIEIISIAGTPTITGEIAVPQQALALLVSPDQRTLYASTDDGRIAVIDLASRAVTMIPGTSQGLHLSMQSEKPLLYVTGNSSQVLEIDLTTNTQRTFATPFQAPFVGQASAPTSDGKFLYVASEAGTVEEFSLTSDARRSFGACNAWGLAISPDDEQLFVACSNGEARIIDRLSGRTELVIPSSTGGTRRVSVSPDGFVVLMGAAPGGVMLIK
jgi:hypothetical protein